MAFRNAGTPVWIGPGGTQSWSYGWGDDHGQEFASADMKTPGAEMVVVAESERKETGGAITYFVTFKNNGPQWCYTTFREEVRYESNHRGGRQQCRRLSGRD